MMSIKYNVLFLRKLLCLCVRRERYHQRRQSDQQFLHPHHQFLSCLIKIFHLRTFPSRACISITQLSILIVNNKNHTWWQSHSKKTHYKACQFIIKRNRI
ncbi:hypothetical protein PanWU01x14_275180 [Parasponia andersonii]|uniref:Uncharacterized protein n=1 Tax=Parasponia andersonii TaxID=3476 RepID=A0A2P5B3E8_PARAD|nr:hypothetical protein PanWU01x14_275180 [Parasponia andersonii]